MTIEEQIKHYISRNILFSDDGFNYAEEASLLDEGIVDSIAIMELVAFVEDTMNVRVEEEEIIPNNFDSVANLASYIRRKQGQAV
jgi:acyl carrier protein